MNENRVLEAGRPMRRRIRKKREAWQAEYGRLRRHEKRNDPLRRLDAMAREERRREERAAAHAALTKRQLAEKKKRQAEAKARIKTPKRARRTRGNGAGVVALFRVLTPKDKYIDVRRDGWTRRQVERRVVARRIAAETR